MSGSSLSEYIERMKRWENRTYFVDYRGYRKKSWTFRAVRGAVIALAQELALRGIGKADSVILFGRSSPEWVIAFFAILRRGAIAVPLDASAEKEFFRKVLRKTGPALIICDSLPRSTRTPSLSFDFIDKLAFNLKHDEAGRSAPATSEEIADPGISPDDIAEIVFTSGATSDPKGVVLTHGNIFSNLKPIADGVEKHHTLVRLLTPFRILCTVPFSHMFGQATGIFLPILIGSTIFFTRDTAPSSLIRMIKKERILALIAVPRILKLLADHVRAEIASRGKARSFERRWSRRVGLPYPIRVLFFLDIHRMLGLHFWAFIAGGAPLDPETHEFWRRLVFSVFQGYGLTETAPIVTMFNPFKHNRASVGKLFPGQEVKIAPDGEILIKGPNVMSGYYKNRKGTEEALSGGWLKTGDIGEMDFEGHLFIKGRKKDMIVTAEGLNVFAEDVERTLRDVSGVRDAAIIGKKTSGGELVHAVLLLEKEADAELVVIKANSALLPYQKIRGYSVWHGADFPRTPTQKVRKAEVTRLLQEKGEMETGAGAGAGVGGDIFEGLVSKKVKSDERLVEDLGLDSLDLAELASRVERRYGTSIDETMLGPGMTIVELERIALHPPHAFRLTMPRWTRRVPVSFLRRLLMDFLILPVFRSVYDLRCAGLQNLTSLSEPCIIAANHTSDLDPVFILLCLPWKLRSRVAPALGLNRFRDYFGALSRPVRKGRPENREGTAIKEASRLPFRRLFQGLGYFLVTLLFQTFPFPQATAFRASLEYTGELLDSGRWILIFPEGEVSKTGELGRFRGGVSRIAELTAAPVVPVGISMRKTGAEGGINRAVLKKRKVTVSFCGSLGYGGEGYNEFAAKLESAVQNVLLK